MGVVYKARQTSLNRLVALKMLRAGAHAAPEQMARFHVEAESVARLKHPNIVQIYEVGEHDHCPYFSMELVEGSSLDEVLGGRPQPHDQAASLIEILARAVHYAHLRGIVHRDLKPANILLELWNAVSGMRKEEETIATDPSALFRTPNSAFHIKISDFGLAKRLEDESHTQSGIIAGTPSYMAPEQAAGKFREIGPPTDVYALGAILYEALTGHPPFGKGVVLDILHRVIAEEPVHPSRLRPKLPRDLETICLKCLRKGPAQRYASAEALAEDLRRFRQGEPIQARPVPTWERALKWSRRRPTAAALLLVSALATLTLILAGWWFAHHERQRAAEADVLRYQAEVNFQQALDVVDQMVTRVAQERLATAPGMTQVRQQWLEYALAFYTHFLESHTGDARVRRETARAYQRIGDIHRIQRQDARAERAYHQALALLGELTQEYPEEPLYRQDLATSYNWLGELWRKSGRPHEAGDAYRQALALQTGLVAEFPDQPEYCRDQARSYYNLGILRDESGQPQQAVDLYSQAIEVLESLQAQHPDRPDYRQELARAFLNRGPSLRALKRFDEARSSYGRAIALLRELCQSYPDVPDFPFELAVVYNNLSNLLRGIRDSREAEKANREALALFTKLVADFPRVPDYRQELANTHNSRGNVLADLRDRPGAAASYQAAAALYTQLAHDFPETADYQAGLGRALANLGWLYLKDPGRPDWREARRVLDEAIRHLETAVRADPKNPRYQEALGRARQDRAAAHQRSNGK
jgi:tetratricopeptide (TPR) repeat protein